MQHGAVWRGVAAAIRGGAVAAAWYPRWAVATETDPTQRMLRIILDGITEIRERVAVMDARLDAFTATLRANESRWRVEALERAAIDAAFDRELARRDRNERWFSEQLESLLAKARALEPSPERT